MSTCNSHRPLPLLAMNHVSRVCADLEASYRFYSEVLGFVPVKRPSSFEFEGAWLFNYGVGLHLIKGCPPARPSKIEPKACHISFQAISLEAVEECLVQRSIPHVKNVFIEDGVQIGQLFFHDPDNNMIEVCNCDQLPVVPLTEAALACAARPPLAATTAAALAHSAVAAAHPDLLRAGHVPSTSSIDSGASDSGCDEPSAAACSSDGGGAAATAAAATAVLTPVGVGVGAGAARFGAVASDVSFSHSSMSGLTLGGPEPGQAMSFSSAGELDEWPTMTSGLSVLGAGASPLRQCKGPVLGEGDQEMVHV